MELNGIPGVEQVTVPILADTFQIRFQDFLTLGTEINNTVLPPPLGFVATFGNVPPNFLGHVDLPGTKVQQFGAPSPAMDLESNDVRDDRREFRKGFINQFLRYRLDFSTVLRSGASLLESLNRLQSVVNAGGAILIFHREPETGPDDIDLRVDRGASESGLNEFVPQLLQA